MIPSLGRINNHSNRYGDGIDGIAQISFKAVNSRQCIFYGILISRRS